MKARWLEKRIDYDGTQLRSLFAYLDHGLLGDSIVGFRGACQVSFEHMVDGEDLLAESQICGSDMVHFIIEKFDFPLVSAVVLQRLLASIVLEKLRSHLPADRATHLRREGDDIFYADQKFSISIATLSPVSALIHFAVNVANAGTPVKTCALEDFGLTAEPFAQEVLSSFSQEFAQIVEASQKVRWVR